MTSDDASPSKSTPFSAMYDATAASMRAEFERVRASLTHSGMRGDANEEIVRKFLMEALPSSVGVTVGQVVDAGGKFSGQSDVILYDNMTTPMLFTSAQGATQTVPIEGVIAVLKCDRRGVPDASGAQASGSGSYIRACAERTSRGRSCVTVRAHGCTGKPAPAGSSTSRSSPESTFSKCTAHGEPHVGHHDA